ncbi:hypothetical protein MMC24_000550 [Lignoscripta atroalba]|nr:hypothetical protein [Lignoscripta atroalba]
MLVSFVCTYVIGVSTSWVNRSSFPPSLGGSTVISLILLFLGAGTYLYFGALTDRPRTQTQRRFFARMPSSLYTLLTFLLVLRIILEFSRSSDLNYHPIDFLIREADQQHNTWLRQASASRTLRQATDEYRRRYDRHPPPGFDKWYDYATTRSSLIIDDYDSIFENLLPFWALEPQHLRARTREILLDPWNEVAEVSIRSGKAEIGPSVLPTHRWMVEGVLEMLGNFAEWLPDMDLAFNINDESRVAVPYHTLENYRKIGMRAGRLEVGKSPEWSSNRADTWRPIDETAIPPSRFEDHSFVNNFYSYSSIACPPSSPARRTRIWDPRILCTSCFSPHSIGPFLSNWTLSASPCHQPDLANLHGFYLSPAAFKTAHELLPVFSQSKPHGYADILYPSPWNYMDKVKYDPSPPSDDPNDQGPYPDLPFAEKENTLFWRGATSEGVSVLGTWKGMTRQRLIHLSTPNLTSSSSSSSFSQPPILLPHPTHPQKYTYQPLSPFTSLLNFTPSLSLVSHISRCGGPDCPDQATEFAPLLPPSDFQAHWRHKFLVDVDGAGFSGRFLPFLQSGCLPFKAALFREWWDGRVTAWRHFVPLDLRLQGVWSTVAYFVGVGGGGGAEGGAGAGEGAGGSGGAHIKEAETIAEAGRAWAAKVLRKEDMEVYFFRLLLEWGRLTDDRRDEIGF